MYNSKPLKYATFLAFFLGGGGGVGEKKQKKMRLVKFFFCLRLCGVGVYSL
jgi:hypothetical protein